MTLQPSTRTKRSSLQGSGHDIGTEHHHAEPHKNSCDGKIDSDEGQIEGETDPEAVAKLVDDEVRVSGQSRVHAAVIRRVAVWRRAQTIECREAGSDAA